MNPNKLYLIDTGLIRAMCVKMDMEKGWLLENLVYMTLRRGMNQIEYCLTVDGREVDFHVFDQVTKKSRLIQVAWEISNDQTFEWEVSALRDASRVTGIKDCTIVTWDDERDLGDGIRCVPVWRWCLEEN